MNNTIRPVVKCCNFCQCSKLIMKTHKYFTNNCIDNQVIKIVIINSIIAEFFCYQ